MKLAIATISLLATSWTSSAFAGAYSLSCESSDGLVKVTKGSLSIAGEEFQYFGEDASVRLMGNTIVDFLKEGRPKVVVSSPDADTAVAQGGVKVSRTKRFKDDCGNRGEETDYSEAVGIYNTEGKTLLNVVRLKCTERIIVGHCS